MALELCRGAPVVLALAVVAGGCCQAVSTSEQGLLLLLDGAGALQNLVTLDGTYTVSVGWTGTAWVTAAPPTLDLVDPVTGADAGAPPGGQVRLRTIGANGVLSMGPPIDVLATTNASGAQDVALAATSTEFGLAWLDCRHQDATHRGAPCGSEAYFRRFGCP